ncbi:MAG: hypothetical protein U0894_18345 [Pirellulales bacterium]
MCRAVPQWQAVHYPAKNELLLVILVPEAKSGSAVSVTYPANPVGEGVYEVLGEGIGIPPALSRAD